MDTLRVNDQRLHADFTELATIGATPEGGVNRPALSAAHLAARDWFRRRAIESGLEFHQDDAGNHSALLRCGGADAPTLLLGSHLDSVPNGGRFDGALGLLAALEALRTVKEANLSLKVNLEAIDFTDEEGTLVGLLGSAALARKLSEADLQRPRGGRQALLEGLSRAGLSEEGLLSAHRPRQALAGYLELHIEQGPLLLKARVQIGVVTGIIGIASFRLVFSGRADHAGTTPLPDRLDAAQGACAFTLAIRQLVLEQFPQCVANVGVMQFEPGAYNIVPERAIVGLELRAPDEATFVRLEAALLERARLEAQRFGLGLEVTPLGKHLPAPLSLEA